MKFHPKPGVAADRRAAQPRRKPTEDMQLSAAVHLFALVAMVILFAAMLTLRGC